MNHVKSDNICDKIQNIIFIYIMNQFNINNINKYWDI